MTSAGALIRFAYISHFFQSRSAVLDAVLGIFVVPKFVSSRFYCMKLANQSDFDNDQTKPTQVGEVE